MFHAQTPQHNKDVILQSLLLCDGVVRVVFATVALGMGVNLRDVNIIIHYGAPKSIEDYFQESGRGGRSGGDAVSTIYWKPSDCPVSKQPTSLRDYELIAVRRYVENSTLCRRRWLLDHFDMKLRESIQRCCDVCSNSVLEVMGAAVGAEDEGSEEEDCD
jgi:superfamily II DNA helicase RecQ